MKKNFQAKPIYLDEYLFKRHLHFQYININSPQRPTFKFQQRARKIVLKSIQVNCPSPPTPVP